LLRDDASAISKQDKGKGTSPFPLFLHHPATAGWDGKSTTFAVTKVWCLSFCVRGQFCEPGPNLETSIFARKMGKNQPTSEKLAFLRKNWEAEIG
jgi:hypothetical protein